MAITTENKDAEAAKLRAKYKETCDQYVSGALTENRSIQFLIEQLDRMGCTPPQGFIRCTDCGPLQAVGAFHLLSKTEMQPVSKGRGTGKCNKSLPAACGSYFSESLKKIARSAKSEKATQHQVMEQLNALKEKPSTITTKIPEIFLCQQHLSNEGQAHRTIVHELVHAVDTCRAEMDPQKNCIHLACTEIRAENLSGDCNFWNEVVRVGPHSLKKHGQDCVKRRAMLSVKSHPRCRDRAEEYVDAAMRRCYNDMFPFECHPNEQPP